MNRPAVRPEDAGLSSILGAILLFGLVVSTLATVQVQYVPVWDEKREGRLMDQLASELAVLQADLNRQVGNGTSAPLGVPLTLAPPDGFSFFTGSTLPGTATFHPAIAGAGLSLSSPRVTLAGVEGVDLYVLSEAWDPIVDGTQVDDVASIQHLRIRVNDPENAGDGDAVTLTLRHPTTGYQGKMVLFNDDVSSEYVLISQVFSAASATTPITQVTHGWKKNGINQGAYYVDVMAPELGFSAVLAAAPKPIVLDWTNTLPDVDAALVHTDASSGLPSAGGGLVVPDFAHQVSGGRLEVARDNQRFPAQRYVLEYGALLLEQPDGVAMVAPPAFSARTDSGKTTLAWAVPELVGSADSVGSSRSARLASAPMGPRVDLTGYAPRLSFTLTTDHPQAWAAYFEEALHAGGLRSASGQFQVSSTASSVTVLVTGLVPPPADPTQPDPTDDLALHFTDALLSLSLLPSG